MKLVPRRNSEKLREAIIDYIRPNTIVYSDKYAAYIKTFSESVVYEHGTVNHSFNFVDPGTGLHTQNIESLWSAFKRFKIKKALASSSTFLCIFLNLFS